MFGWIAKTLLSNWDEKELNVYHLGVWGKLAFNVESTAGDCGISIALVMGMWDVK